MKLKHLTIKDINAFTGDPRVIDFTAQPEGLICVRGDNGAGKSTVMSFSGPSTLYLDDPDRGSLYGCARSADGSTVLEFEHGGSDYKIEVAVDVHTTKRGNLHQSMKPRIWKDGAEVKGIEGKNHAYLDYVNKMFGSKEDFLATVYAAQTGEGKFDKLDRGNRKDMFRRMLGLDHYEVLAERCKATSWVVALSPVRTASAVSMAWETSSRRPSKKWARKTPMRRPRMPSLRCVV